MYGSEGSSRSIAIRIVRCAGLPGAYFALAFIACRAKRAMSSAVRPSAARRKSAISRGRSRMISAVHRSTLGELFRYHFTTASDVAVNRGLTSTGNSCRRLDVADFFENAPEIGLRGEAHGSISVQEGQPVISLIFLQFSHRQTRRNGKRTTDANKSAQRVLYPFSTDRPYWLSLPPAEAEPQTASRRGPLDACSE